MIILLLLVISPLVVTTEAIERRRINHGRQLAFPRQPEGTDNSWDHVNIQNLDDHFESRRIASPSTTPAATFRQFYPGLPQDPGPINNELPQPIPPNQPSQPQPLPPATTPILLPPGCLAARGQFPSSKSCANYLNCWDDVVIEQTCPGGLLFNEYNMQCDFDYNVNCGSRPGPTPKPPLSPDSKRCPELNGRYRSATNCSEFYVCLYSSPIKFSCPAGLVYNDELNVCDYPYRVNCGSAATPQPPSQPLPEGQPPWGTQQTIGSNPPSTGGSQQLPGGSQQLPGGSQQLPGGSQQLPGGSQQHPEGQPPWGTQQTIGSNPPPSGGSQQLPGGSQQLPGGSQQLPGGSQQHPEGQPPWGTQQTIGSNPPPSGGSQQLPGGSQQLPGGSQQLPGGSQQLPGGSQQLPGGSQQLPGGSQQWPGGSQQLPGGSQQLPGGSQQLPGGSQQLPGGSQQLPGGSQQLPGGSQQLPGGSQQLPGGAYPGGGGYFPSYPASPYESAWITKSDSDTWNQKPPQFDSDWQRQPEDVGTSTNLNIQEETTTEDSTSISNPWEPPLAIPAEVLKVPCNNGEVHKLNDACTNVVICRGRRPQLVQCPTGFAYDIPTDACTHFTLAKC